MPHKRIVASFVVAAALASTLAATAAEITVAQTPNGAISPGSTIVAPGASKRFTFTPGAGFTLDKAIVDGSSSAVVSPWSVYATQGADRYVRSIVYLGKGVVVAVGDTIVRSTDFGRTWANVAPAGNTAVLLKVINAGGGVVIAGASSGRIFRSTDYGQTWRDLGAMFSQTHVYALASLGNGVILAGTTRNWTTGLLLRSTDYGATWTSRGNLGAERNIIALEYIRTGANRGVVLAGTAGVTGNIWRSTDLGATWTNLGNRFGAIVSDVDFFTHLGNGIVIASTYPNGHMLRSLDYGLTWSDLGKFDAGDKLSAAASAGNGIAVVGGGTDGHLWRTTDYGATWTDLGRQGAESVMRPAYATNGLFLAGTYPNGQILRSTRYGLGRNTTYTFTNVQANHTLSGAFVPIPPP